MQVQVTRLLGATSKGSTPTLNFLGASGTALSDQRPVLVRVDAVLTGSAACLEDIVPALFLHSKQQSRQAAELTTRASSQARHRKAIPATVQSTLPGGSSRCWKCVRETACHSSKEPDADSCTASAKHIAVFRFPAA